MTEYPDPAEHRWLTAVEAVTVLSRKIADSIHLRSLSGSDERIFDEFIVRRTIKDATARAISNLLPDPQEGSGEKLGAIALAAFEARLAELGNTANIRGNA